MRSIKSWIIAIALLHCLAGDNRLVRIFHGLGDDCKNFKFPKGYEYIGCVETGAGNASLTSTIEKMAQKGCEELKKEVELFKQFGVNFICYSQGGIIARYLLKSCTEVTPFVKKIVFVGTPHLGITELPTTKDFEAKDKTKQDAELEKILRNNYFSDIGNYRQNEMIKKIDAEVKPVDNQANKPEEEADLTSFFKDLLFDAAKMINKAAGGNTCAPAQYYHQNLGQGAIIKDISDKSMDSIYSGLEMVLNILNQDERVIIPKESVTFGVELIQDNKDGSKVLRHQMVSSNFLNQYPHGLGKLFQDGRMINCVSSSSHAMLNKLDMKVIYNTFLNDKFLLWEEPLAVLEGTKKEERIERILKNRDEFIKEYPNFCQRHQDNIDEHSEESVPIEKGLLFTEYQKKLGQKVNFPQTTVQAVKVNSVKQNPSQAYLQPKNGPDRVLTGQSSGEVPRIRV